MNKSQSNGAGEGGGGGDALRRCVRRFPICGHCGLVMKYATTEAGEASRPEELALVVCARCVSVSTIDADGVANMLTDAELEALPAETLRALLRLIDVAERTRVARAAANN